MTKLFALVISLGLLAAFTGCAKNSSQTETSTAPQSASPKITFPGQNGWDPTAACAHLADKLKPGLYTTEGGNVYRCLSSPKNLEAGSSPNNIVYYASGEALRARQVGLVLYVYNSAGEDAARQTLLEYSRELSEKALGVPLSQAVSNAILAGEIGRGKVDTARVEVLRRESPSGKGYEMYYVITPQLKSTP